MSRYLLRRLSHTVLVIIGISVISFFFLHLSGDPVGLILPQDATRAQIEALRAQMRLDEPLVVQYLHFAGSALQGDLRRSIYTREPVLRLILERMPATLELAIAALVLSLVIAIPVGVLAAVRRGSWLDMISMSIALFGLSMPHFWLGIMFIMLFSVQLGWFPSIYDTTLRVTDWDSFLRQVRQMAMPVFVLALCNAAQISRYMRASMLDNLNQDYVRTARAKGMTERTVVLVHVLRNSMIPVITVIALGVPGVFTGAIITENVFKVNGLGQQLLLSIQGNDAPMVLTITLMFAILIVLFNLIADILYGILDPGIRYD